VHATDKARSIPNFLYRFYRLAYSTGVRSFELDTSANATRYSNLFIVFFMFFKYGISNRIRSSVIKPQRKLLKSSVQFLRGLLLSRFVRDRRLSNKRVLELRSVKDERAKLLSVIHRKLVSNGSDM